MNAINLMRSEKFGIMPESAWVGIQTFIICSIILTISGYAFLLRRSNAGIRTFSSSNSKLSVRLIDRVEVAPRVYRLRFSLPSVRHILGLPIGCHISLSAKIPISHTDDDAKYVSRQYTPVTTDYEEKGYFDLVVKVYRKHEHPYFPEGGLMSQYLETLPVGALIDIKGPGGRIKYLEAGRFLIGSERVSVKHVGMIAGGTGITPMYQIIRHVVETRRGRDSLGLSLLYANQHPGDILLRTELETFHNSALNQFKLAYTVDRVEKDEKWSGHMGFVSDAMIRECMPPPSEDVLFLLCGPPPMIKSVRCILQSLGYREDRIYAF